MVLTASDARGSHGTSLKWFTLNPNLRIGLWNPHHPEPELQHSHYTPSRCSTKQFFLGSDYVTAVSGTT